MSLSYSIRTLVACLAFGVSGVSFGADETRESRQPADVANEAAQIADLIKRLDSNRFTERSEAGKQLEAIGKSAIPALTEAASGENREVRMRAIEILHKQFDRAEGDLKAAAKQALEKIAAGQNDSAARQAKEALNPKPQQQALGVPGMQGIQLGAMPIQIQVQAAAGGMRRQMRVTNGVKEIEADENGIKTKITEDPNNGLKIEVTETKDGKEVKRQYSAKNADELKKKQPEAYKIYEKYNQQPGAFQIQIQGLQMAPGLQPLPAGGLMPAPVPAAQPAGEKAAAAMLRGAKQMVEMAAKNLERGDLSAEKKAELAQTRKRLEEIAKQLEEERAKLGTP